MTPITYLLFLQIDDVDFIVSSIGDDDFLWFKQPKLTDYAIIGELIEHLSFTIYMDEGLFKPHFVNSCEYNSVIISDRNKAYFWDGLFKLDFNRFLQNHKFSFINKNHFNT